MNETKTEKDSLDRNVLVYEKEIKENIRVHEENIKVQEDQILNYQKEIEKLGSDSKEDIEKTLKMLDYVKLMQDCELIILQENINILNCRRKNISQLRMGIKLLLGIEE